jgi:hypothetical protein
MAARFYIKEIDIRGTKMWRVYDGFNDKPASGTKGGRDGGGDGYDKATAERKRDVLNRQHEEIQKKRR